MSNNSYSGEREVKIASDTQFEGTRWMEWEYIIIEAEKFQ